MLAVLAERQVRSGGRVRLLTPEATDIARYLSRMRLRQLLDGFSQEHDLPPVREWESGHELLELRRFDGPDEPDRLGEMLLRKTQADFDVARALHQSVAELGVNVPDHSGLDVGFVAAQSTYRHSVVQFAVGDGGVGVAAALEDASSDGDALQQVMNGRSRLNEPGRGQGLAKTQRLLLGMRGSLHMLSGAAHRTHYGTGASCGEATVTFPGTLLQGTFAVPAP